jgi:hypothetical protein
MAATRNFLLNMDLTRNLVQVQCLVTPQFVNAMATRESHVVDQDLARSASLAAQPGTAVVAGRSDARTALDACKGAVHDLRVALGRALVTAAVQAAVAAEVAAAVGTEAGEVVGLTAPDWPVDVPRTAELECRADGIAGLELASDVNPHSDIRVRVGVADEIHAVLGAAQQHVDAVRRLEETDLAAIVAANQRDNDDFGFLALEIVDGGETDLTDEFLLLERGLAGMPSLGEAISGQNVLVLLTKKDLKVVGQSGAELL